MDETSAATQSWVPFQPNTTAESTATNSSPHHLKAFADGDDSPSFKDVLDTINPLQHIPIVNTIYRELTGDVPGAMSRIAGGALFGGPLGMALETMDVILSDQTGHDVGGHVWVALMGDDTANPDQAVKVAETKPSKTDEPVNLVASLEPAKSPEVSAVPAVNVTPIAPVEASPPAIAAEAPQPRALSPKLTSQSASATPTATPAVAGGTALPQGFLPAPTRHSIQVLPPAPPNSMISSSNRRTDVPAAGHVLANTSQTDARGVAVNQSGAVPTAVQPVATLIPTPPANAWLPDAMAKALDKYEKMNKLGQTAQAPAPAPQPTM